MFIEKTAIPNGRVLGIDFGLARIGLAISDPMQQMASPLECLENKGYKSTAIRLQTLLKEYDYKTILIGWPVNMNGTEGKQCDLVRNFCTKIYNEIHIPIVKWDERMSTIHLHNFNPTKKPSDHLVAAGLLQELLDSRIQSEQI